MTQIKRLTAATRRPGVLGVHSLDHFSMTVPSLEQARHFYESFGLDVREEGRGLALYAPGLGHRWGILNEGKSCTICRSERSRTTCCAFATGCRSCMSSGSRRRRVSKATGCGSAIITACW